MFVRWASTEAENDGATLHCQVAFCTGAEGKSCVPAPESMVNTLRRLRAVTRARGRWDPLQFNASLVVQPIAERATRLRQPERAFRDPPACFSLLRPARISPAPRRPVYLL